jgi:hypothetical protein
MWKYLPIWKKQWFYTHRVNIVIDDAEQTVNGVQIKTLINQIMSSR